MRMTSHLTIRCIQDPESLGGVDVILNQFEC